MMRSALIRNRIEEVYDIPFSVVKDGIHEEISYIIAPENEAKELFDIKIQVRQRTRLTLEITPQRFSADMLHQMQGANRGKRELFIGYLNLFKEQGIVIEVFINNSKVDYEDENIWDLKWRDFRIKANRIYADGISEEPKEITDIIIRWGTLAVGAMLSLLEIEYESEEISGALEGKLSQVTSNRYERNPINRELCLAANGYDCKVCGFDFEKFYGEIGKGFIHVHHLEMVSAYNGEKTIDPKKDLIPVCPNCHAMLHRSNPPVPPKKLKEMIVRREKENNCGESC
ncbi:5-methylcytosine-specific restriction protein A [Lachnospiraceae bacterium PF1-21]|uniref:HNH endonuclease n=1 Tax=Ohessyouella blattaphilus TaxID=2949333 RepID=UPI003E2E3B9E